MIVKNKTVLMYCWMVPLSLWACGQQGGAWAGRPAARQVSHQQLYKENKCILTNWVRKVQPRQATLQTSLPVAIEALLLDYTLPIRYEKVQLRGSCQIGQGVTAMYARGGSGLCLFVLEKGGYSIGCSPPSVNDFIGSLMAASAGGATFRRELQWGNKKVSLTPARPMLLTPEVRDGAGAVKEGIVTLSRATERKKPTFFWYTTALSYAITLSEISAGVSALVRDRPIFPERTKRNIKKPGNYLRLKQWHGAQEGVREVDRHTMLTKEAQEELESWLGTGGSEDKRSDKELNTDPNEFALSFWKKESGWGQQQHGAIKKVRLSEAADVLLMGMEDGVLGAVYLPKGPWQGGESCPFRFRKLYHQAATALSWGADGHTFFSGGAECVYGIDTYSLALLFRISCATDTMVVGIVPHTTGLFTANKAGEVAYWGFPGSVPTCVRVTEVAKKR